MRKARITTAALTAAGLLLGTALAASATPHTNAPASSEEAIGNVDLVGGVTEQTIVNPDGVETTTYAIPLEPGGGTVGLEFPSQNEQGYSTKAEWGSSYAYSIEQVQIAYTGKGKAAGNVFDGKRIVSVCFWYSRAGKAVTRTWCSNAVSMGSYWQSGPEVTGGTWDTLIPWAPQTIFTMSVTRQPPNVY